jgi:DNA polymerase-1
MATIYLLDVSSYLFRSYFAISRMSNDRGEATNALYGCIRSVLKLLHERDPKYICAVFDGPQSKLSRQTIYPAYKGHRKEIPADLPQQIQWASEWFRWMGIPQLAIRGVEADDSLGSIAVWAGAHGHEVRLCSSDKDLCQLVNDRIHLLNPAKDYLDVGPEQVMELYGVRPDQIVDYLAIVGDASDNIPGLSGFGPKTASQLLQSYDSVEGLLKNVDKLSAKKAETVEKERDTLLLSQRLAQIQLDVEVPQALSAYEKMQVDHEALRTFYRDMSFSSLMSEIATSAPSAKSAAVAVPPVTTVLSRADWKQMCDDLGSAEELCIDTETTSEDPLRADLVGIGISAQDRGVYYIPFGRFSSQELSAQEITTGLSRLWGEGSKGVIGHNIKYDLHVLKRHGFTLPRVGFDTILASYLLFAHAHRHNLDHLVMQLYDYKKIPISELLGSGKAQRTMADVPTEQVAKYCGEDVWFTLKLRQDLGRQLEQRDLTSLLIDVEIPLLGVLFLMEEAGIYVDVPMLKATGAEFAATSEGLAQEIFGACGETFNLNSPKQLGTVLYEHMGLKPVKKTATGPSTSAEALEALISQAPFVQRILDWRQLEKLRSTYVDALPSFILPKDNRIHSTFNQSVAATGRISSHDPNLQNIPIRTAEGKRIREAFRPQLPGYSYLSADYSQIELRLLAHMCEDPELVKAFQRGDDIHRFTASLVAGVPLDQVSSTMRQQAKAVNFGILYGQQAYGLSQATGMPMADAKRFIEQYFERFPSVRQFLERCKEEARQTGCTRTLTGRERLLPDINSTNAQVRAAAERLAVNSPLQGSAADLIKLAMLKVQHDLETQGFRAKMILQIHDELLFEAPDEELEKLGQLVRRDMEEVMALKVPLVVDVSVGRNWRECYT